MSYDLELLETLAYWLHKQPAINKRDDLLREESKRLEKVMLYHLMTLSNDTQLNTYLQINLFKLVEICDLLYLPGNKDSSNASAVLDLIMSLHKTSKTLATQDIVLPLLLRNRLSNNFGSQWSDVLNRLDLGGIDPILIEIIEFAYKNFVNSKLRPRWSTEVYLSAFSEALSDLPQEIDNDYLVILLIRLEFNYSRFTAYCYRWMTARIEEKNQDTKIESILKIKKELRQLTLLSEDRFDSRKSSVVDELSKWLDEEQLGININAAQNLSNQLKINTTLKVLELAYWEKLQYDNGIYDEVNLDILSEKVANNFSSKFQEELSAASIKSKFYPKDRSIIEPIEVLLVKMLEDVRQFLQ